MDKLPSKTAVLGKKWAMGRGLKERGGLRHARGNRNVDKGENRGMALDSGRATVTVIVGGSSMLQCSTFFCNIVSTQCSGVSNIATGPYLQRLPCKSKLSCRCTYS